MPILKKTASKKAINNSKELNQSQLNVGALSLVIKKPRITEKAAFVGDNNCYVFNVANRATKISVAEAVKEIYKVDPIKVNIVTIRPKTIFVKGTKGTKSGGKKAYVYLKKGQTLEII